MAVSWRAWIDSWTCAFHISLLLSRGIRAACVQDLVAESGFTCILEFFWFLLAPEFSENLSRLRILNLMKKILLLTATIRPKAEQPGLVIFNEDVRLKEYAAALDFYINLLNKGVLDAVIFAENSGYDLSQLKKRFSCSKVEWVSCFDLNYPKEYHRGYGEFRLIDFAHKKSEILASASQADFVWKISGRYIIKNVETMIYMSKKAADLHGHFTENWVELSVLGWTKLGYDAFIKGKWELFSSGMAPELILAKELVFLKKNNPELSVISRYQWPPLLIGRRGSDGSSYQGRFYQFRHAARVIAVLIRRWV